MKNPIGKGSKKVIMTKNTARAGGTNITINMRRKTSARKETTTNMPFE